MALAILDAGRQVDVVARLLADKRSENTRRAYRHDLADFFATMTGAPATPENVQGFLSLNRGQGNAAVMDYKAELLERGLAEATVNRRLAAVRSLVNCARLLGVTELEIDVEGEKVQSYRDTRGVSVDAVRAMLGRCNLSTLKGLRDYALLRLLWDNALRRAEVSRLNVEDFDAQAQRLAITGKGKGTQQVWVDLSERTAAAICAWLEARERGKPGSVTQEAALFVAVDNASAGARLSTTGIYKLVRDYAQKAGIERIVSPHRIRHSSITAALEVTNGDVVAVQRLSRHAKVETVMVYNDNRLAQQAKVTNLLAELA